MSYPNKSSDNFSLRKNTNPIDMQSQDKEKYKVGIIKSQWENQGPTEEKHEKKQSAYNKYRTYIKELKGQNAACRYLAGCRGELLHSSGLHNGKKQTKNLDF